MYKLLSGLFLACALVLTLAACDPSGPPVNTGERERVGYS